MKMLTDKDENGDYVIPNIIYSDAYSSEMVSYADLVLPDATYLERHDCISLLDRPICEADGAADAIRWPVIEPDRDVRGFQSVLCDLGARLGLPNFTNEALIMHGGTEGHGSYSTPPIERNPPERGKLCLGRPPASLAVCVPGRPRGRSCVLKTLG